jgi:hypothetical protein
MASPLTSALRWSPRIIGVLLLLVIAQIAIGEGVPNPLHGSLPENLLTLAFAAMIVGQIAAWKWEGVGGLLILGSYILFAVVNHGIPMNIVFAPWLLTGLLYVACWWWKAAG